MPDIRVHRFAGKIERPNPFWLASAPPTNCGEQIMRAFDAGWGGAVWKTIGEPVTNVCSRYSATDWNGQRMMGLNNIELISDRTVEENLREMAEVKKRYPYHAMIASLMVASNREAWHEIVQRAEDAGADGLELNFGCPHGMSERGMGSAVGPGARVHRDDHGVGEGEGAHAGAGQADAEHHRHSRRLRARPSAAAPMGFRRSTPSIRLRGSISTPLCRGRTWTARARTAATAVRR